MANMCDAIVRTAGMVNLQSWAEMTQPPILGGNSKDCRPDFIFKFTMAIKSGNDGYIHPNFQVVAPFVNSSKAEIAKLGSELGVPFEETWSCYNGGEIHCGRCGTCVERAEAFHLAGVEDPTTYESPDFWKEAVGV